MNQTTPKKFEAGAKVRLLSPVIIGVVKKVSDELGPLGEYWHTIETRVGTRREPGRNLELRRL